jgi:hypothetical protein
VSAWLLTTSSTRPGSQKLCDAQPFAVRAPEIAGFDSTKSWPATKERSQELVAQRPLLCEIFGLSGGEIVGEFLHVPSNPSLRRSGNPRALTPSEPLHYLAPHAGSLELPLLAPQVARELWLRNRLRVVLPVVDELDRDHF